MGGVPRGAGTRIPVFPQLDRAAIRQSLLYAAETRRERELPLLSA